MVLMVSYDQIRLVEPLLNAISSHSSLHSAQFEKRNARSNFRFDQRHPALSTHLYHHYYIAVIIIEAIITNAR